jgi:hypothetical protein
VPLGSPPGGFLHGKLRIVEGCCAYRGFRQHSDVTRCYGLFLRKVAVRYLCEGWVNPVQFARLDAPLPELILCAADAARLDTPQYRVFDIPLARPDLICNPCRYSPFPVLVRVTARLEGYLGPWPRPPAMRKADRGLRVKVRPARARARGTAAGLLQRVR